MFLQRDDVGFGSHFSSSLVNGYCGIRSTGLSAAPPAASAAGLLAAKSEKVMRRTGRGVSRSIVSSSKMPDFSSMTAAVTRTSAAPAEMCVAPPVGLVVGVARRVRSTAPEHHLKIDRLEAFVLVAVTDTRRAGNAFPRRERPADPPAAFVLHKDRQISSEYEEDLLDFVRVWRIALPRRQIHDAEGKGPRRDHCRIVVLAEPAGADKTMLCASVAVDLGSSKASQSPFLSGKRPM